MRNISKGITNLMLLSIYIPVRHVLTRNNHPSFKIIDKANSKFDLKVKEILHMN